MYGRNAQTAGSYLYELSFVVRYAAAAAAQRECGAHYHGIAYPSCHGNCGVYILGDVGGNDRLVYLRKRFLKAFPVLRPVYGFGIRAQQGDVHLVQKAFLGKLHRKRKTRLSAQRGQKAVGALFFYNSFDGGKRERLYIYPVRHGVIRHNGGGVGVDKHHFQAVLFERAARLRSRIVEFRCLTYHDRTGAYHHYFMQILIERHLLYLHHIYKSVE